MKFMAVLYFFITAISSKSLMAVSMEVNETFTLQNKLELHASGNTLMMTFLHLHDDCDIFYEGTKGEDKLLVIINGIVHFQRKATRGCFHISSFEGRLVLTVKCSLTEILSGKIVIDDCFHENLRAYYDTLLEEFGIEGLLKIKYSDHSVLIRISSALEECDVQWNTSQGEKKLSLLMVGGKLRDNGKLFDSVNVTSIEHWNVVIITPIFTKEPLQDLMKFHIECSSQQSFSAGFMLSLKDFLDFVTTSPAKLNTTNSPDSTEVPISSAVVTTAPAKFTTTNSPDSTEVPISLGSATAAFTRGLSTENITEKEGEISSKSGLSWLYLLLIPVLALAALGVWAIVHCCKIKQNHENTADAVSSENTPDGILPENTMDVILPENTTDGISPENTSLPENNILAKMFDHDFKTNTLAENIVADIDMRENRVAGVGAILTESNIEDTSLTQNKVEDLHLIEYEDDDVEDKCYFYQNMTQNKNVLTTDTLGDNYVTEAPFEIKESSKSKVIQKLIKQNGNNTEETFTVHPSSPVIDQNPVNEMAIHMRSDTDMPLKEYQIQTSKGLAPFEMSHRDESNSTSTTNESTVDELSDVNKKSPEIQMKEANLVSEDKSWEDDTKPIKAENIKYLQEYENDVTSKSKETCSSSRPTAKAVQQKHYKETRLKKEEETEMLPLMGKKGESMASTEPPRIEQRFQEKSSPKSIKSEKEELFQEDENEFIPKSKESYSSTRPTDAEAFQEKQQKKTRPKKETETESLPLTRKKGESMANMEPSRIEQRSQEKSSPKPIKSGKEKLLQEGEDECIPESKERYSTTRPAATKQQKWNQKTRLKGETELVPLLSGKEKEDATTIESSRSKQELQELSSPKSFKAGN